VAKIHEKKKESYHGSACGRAGRGYWYSGVFHWSIHFGGDYSGMSIVMALAVVRRSHFSFACTKYCASYRHINGSGISDDADEHCERRGRQVEKENQLDCGSDFPSVSRCRHRLHRPSVSVTSRTE